MSSALAERKAAWVSETLANRAVVMPLAETTQFSGRVRGLPSIAVLGETEAETTGKLREAIDAYAERLLAAGHELPFWGRALPEVSPDMRRLVRMANLRRLLKDRAAQWGAPRAHLAAGICEDFLADLDQLLTRHAIRMSGTLKK